MKKKSDEYQPVHHLLKHIVWLQELKYSTTGSKLATRSMGHYREFRKKQSMDNLTY